MAKIKSILVHCACLLALFALPAVQAEAPAIALKRVDNGALGNMGDYIGQGQWVVVNVWSPSCGFCVRELPLVEKLHADRGQQLSVLGVTIDFPSFGYGRIDTIEAFLQTRPLAYPLFLADMAMASELIGMRLVGIPLIAIFHPDGRPLVRWPGKIEPEEIYRFIDNYEEVEEDELSLDF